MIYFVCRNFCKFTLDRIPLNVTFLSKKINKNAENNTWYVIMLYGTVLS